MALPACFRLADDVFPRVRAEAARRLVAAGWSQTRTATVLAVSQAMVSKYAARDDDEQDALVLQLVDSLLDDLDSPSDPGGASPWCQVLAPADGREGGQEALEDLLEAERTIVGANVHALVPQIGLNTVRCTPTAKGPGDVLAYPGRIIHAGDRLLAPLPPAWGASNHLASCLLALREKAPTMLAMANVRGTPDVVQVAKAIGAHIVRVDRGDDQSDAPILAACRKGAAFIHDPGAVGVEPCLYLAGDNARAVANTIQSLHQRLSP